MAFKVDSQTLNDLNIFNSSSGKDIFSLFNKTRTRGGAEILKDMFLYPISQANEIASRVSAIKLFKREQLEFPFSTSVLDTIEFYLSNTDERTKLSGFEDNLKRKFDQFIGSNTEHKQIYSGIEDTLQFIRSFNQFILRFKSKVSDVEFDHNFKKIYSILTSESFRKLNTEEGKQKWSYEEAVKYDESLRFDLRDDILKLLNYAYEIDVFIAVAEVSDSMKFNFAEINTSNFNTIELKGVYHPLVSNAVSNDVLIDENNNIIFLTGANMAGKSTFMKTFSIAMYLAHIGFPVPVEQMRFSIQDGMFTTINLADSLNMGFSHFYAEVSRVKKIAQEVNTHDRLIVVFDELFRGTNVKDAYDATIAVISAFASKRKCTFIVSTHIVEAGEVLKKLHDNIKFLYLPTLMKGALPEYTYKVKEGITEDRHGMLIIKNENILDILKS
ncbi:hypothetical protein NO995_14815 [Aestuariibaculum sp. M13]|uniref:MutS-related protein n=1 Tax=Aestuariibaculum sp. M13 TaxID=2967132 RepID=UPI002159DBA1|nr:hypothetical protein [Aestuariibaculum sp. M13]MCR8668956.1 hypothetical protein [Aestuariibaculum sp. M13]